jgi:hypothetical protein
LGGDELHFLRFEMQKISSPAAGCRAAEGGRNAAAAPPQGSDPVFLLGV